MNINNPVEKILGLGFPRPRPPKLEFWKKYPYIIIAVIISSYTSSQTMFSKPVKKKPRLVIKLTKLKNIRYVQNEQQFSTNPSILLRFFDNAFQAWLYLSSSHVKYWWTVSFLNTLSKNFNKKLGLVENCSYFSTY